MLDHNSGFPFGINVSLSFLCLRHLVRRGGLGHPSSGRARVAQLASSCVRSIGNLELMLNSIGRLV